MSSHPSITNRELCELFRSLLTTGFYVVSEDGELVTPTKDSGVMTETKPWRNDVWQTFKEIEDRLCPVQAHEREHRKRQREREAASLDTGLHRQGEALDSAPSAFRSQDPATSWGKHFSK